MYNFIHHLIPLFLLLFNSQVFCDKHFAPYFIDQPSFSDGIVPKGQSTALQCKAQGFPPPQFMWFKDGIALTNFSQNPQLNLPEITEEDGGQYHCVAKNSEGSIASDKTTLVVAYLKVAEPYLKELEVKSKDVAILSPPPIDSVPPAIVRWQHEGGGPLVGRRFASTQDGRLVILETNPEDAGHYTAHISNPKLNSFPGGGGVTITFILKVTAPLIQHSLVAPKIIVAPQDNIFEQGSFPAILECIASGIPLKNLKVVWSKDGKVLTPLELPYSLESWNRTLTLTNVGPHHSGVYECEASVQGIETTDKASARVTVHIPPTLVLKPNPEVIVSVGTPFVELPCSAQGIPTPTISWLRDADVITHDPMHSTLHQNGSLILLDLQLSDTGIYQCEASNSIGSTTATVWLHVTTAKPLFLRSPQNVSTLHGRDAQLECQVMGAPTPNVTWYFRGLPLPSSQILESGNLLIAGVRADHHEGEYTCIRANIAGEVRGSAYLTVLRHTQISGPPVPTKVILGSTAELQCRVSHDPKVPFNLTWLFNNKPLAPGGRIQVLEDGTLHIGLARNLDVGTYTCRVSSPGGNDSRSARLDVIELPHPPTNVQASLLPKGVNVTWTKPFDGNSPIHSFVVQLKTIPQDGTSFDDELLAPWSTVKVNVSSDQNWVVLNGLKPASSYQFRVSAVNGVGEGEPSQASSTVVLPAEPPSAPPQGVVGGARSSTAIMLQWQPPPSETWNGVIRGYAVRYKLAGYSTASGAQWTVHNVTHEAQHSLLLQDLIVWQNYEIQVAACNDEGIGVFSPSIFIRTREGVPQSSPSNVQAFPLSSTSIRVRWSPPDPQLINGINQGYKIEAWNGSDVAQTVTVAPSPINPLAEQSTEVGDLAKYTSYNVTVLCFTSPGDGPRSMPVAVTTLPDVPTRPGALWFEDVLDTSVHVHWKPPNPINGDLLGYTLRYHVKDIPETAVVSNISSSSHSLLVEGLRPVTAYTFELLAWTQVGPGPSRTATIQSGIPPVLPTPPRQLAVSNIGAFSVILQFTPGFDGNTSITRWVVEAQKGNQPEENWATIYETVDPDATSLHVVNLSPFTEYRLRLIAYNVVGSSGPSQPTQLFQTLQSSPAHAPYNVTVRAVNANSLRVRWTPLQQTEWHGIPRGYNITYREANDNFSPIKSVILEDHNANSYVLTLLEEFTPYTVFVQAFNDVGISPPSPEASEWTREAVPSSGPSNVTAWATSSTTVVVSWNEVPFRDQNGLIEGFKVRFGAKHAPHQIKVLEGNTTNTTTLTELRKYTTYSIQVLAYSRIGDGIPSMPPILVTTFQDVPGVPSNISFPDVSSTTARIIWDVPAEPNGVITAYRVSYGNTSKELDPTVRTWKAFDLNPDTYYEFKVTAQTKEGWGKTAVAQVYTTNNREAPQPPSAPHISKSQVQARRITFTWTPGRDGFAPLRYYLVQLREGSEGPWRTLPHKVEPGATMYTVQNLKPSTSYIFRLQAVNDIGPSRWSPESEQANTLPAAPERPPEGIMVTPYTRTAVRVSWQPLSADDWNGDSSAPAAGYRVEFCPQSPLFVDCPSVLAAGIDATTISLQDLEPNTNYEIRVYATNAQGDSIPSQPVTVFVGEAVPNGEPQNIHVEALRSNEIRVNWDPPPVNQQNGDLMGYKIFYWTPGGLEVMEALPATTTTFVLSDLVPYTEYNIQVLAFNPAGDGPRSPIRSARTLEALPGPPGKLHFSDITMSSVNVSWDPPAAPNGRLRGYLVVFETAHPDVNFSKQVKQKVSSHHLWVGGLSEGVSYTFTVRAETGVGQGPASTGNVTTGPQPGSPGAPQDLALHHTRTSITLVWRNGPAGASPLTGYLIESKQASGDEKDQWQSLAQLVNGPQESYAISFQNLRPSTRYNFRVLARNRYGVSPPAVLGQHFDTPHKWYLYAASAANGDSASPFYREVWFLVLLAFSSLIIILLVVSILCFKSHQYSKKHRSASPARHSTPPTPDIDVIPPPSNNGGFEMRHSKRGGTLSRKNNGIAKAPPRPSPASITYSDDEDVKGYDENCDSSSLTEKPSELSSTDSQGSESECEAKLEPHSFVNHYANVNDTLRQSWKRQRPVVRPAPPSYTDSEPEGSVAVSLNGGHIIMNNMAGSRAPLPGFSSFV